MRPEPWFNWFSFAYLWLLLQVLAVELYGVFRSAQRDTISENWWLFQAYHPVAARVAMTVFLGWLYLHFCWQQEVYRWLGVKL